jgi:hypothetical protein
VYFMFIYFPFVSLFSDRFIPSYIFIINVLSSCPLPISALPWCSLFSFFSYFQLSLLFSLSSPALIPPPCPPSPSCTCVRGKLVGFQFPALHPWFNLYNRIQLLVGRPARAVGWAHSGTRSRCLGDVTN